MNTVRLSVSGMGEVAAGLSVRDLQVVSSVAKFKLMTTKHIERLYFVDGTPSSNERRSRLALNRLTKLRVLHRLERRVGGVRSGSSGQVYTLDVVGQFVANVAEPSGRKRRPFEPGWPYVAHTLKVSELFVRLTEAAREGRFELVEFEPEPTSWRSFFGPGGGRVSLKPDAFVRAAKGEFEELRFVEVDLATESSTALIRKFRTYRQYWVSGKEQIRWDGVFPRVLWLAPSIPRLRMLVDVAGRQPAESWQLFGMRLFDEAAGAFIPEDEP